MFAPPRQTEPVDVADAAGGSGLTGPLLLWLLVQFMALLAAVLRVPLAAHYPQPAELLAAHVVVVVQVTAAALLFPSLLRDRYAAVAVVATAVPFQVLAAVLSAVPAARGAAAGTYAIAWIVALWGWNAAGSGRGRAASATTGVGAAAAALLTAGTLAAFYLRLEFAADAPGDPHDLAAKWAAVSPPLAALHLLADAPAARDACVPALLAGAACVRHFFARRSSQVIHRP